MSRGEPIASPVDPTREGYRGSLTPDPKSAPKGHPGKVEGPVCACGNGFIPAQPHHRECPDCWQKDRPGREAGQADKRDIKREDAIARAEQAWEETQREWGMS